MIFKMLVENEDSQIVVLKALHQVWKNHQQVKINFFFRFHILIEKKVKLFLRLLLSWWTKCSRHK